jgi:predicted ester cyclase
LVSWRPDLPDSIIGQWTDRNRLVQMKKEVTQVADTEDQKRQLIVRLYEDVLNQGRLEILDEIARRDHVEHDPLPGQEQGVEGLKQRVSMLRAAFDPHFTIEHLVVDGDKVAVMWTNLGTHLGEWFGFPPTGKRLTTHGVDVHLMRDGRLAEHWHVVDMSAFLVEMGAVAAPAAAPGGGR